MKPLFSLLIILLIAGCASSQPRVKEVKTTDPDYQAFQEEMCRQVMCQRNILVKLKQEDGSFYEKHFDVFPVVQENGVAVVAGQTVAFEADVHSGQLTNLKLVESISQPDKTITAKFEQSDDGSMMLALKNPFDKPIRIRMGIMPLGKNDLYRTSSCPVIAKGGSYEMWPYPIFQVWLGDMRLMTEGEDMSCIE